MRKKFFCVAGLLSLIFFFLLFNAYSRLTFYHQRQKLFCDLERNIASKISPFGGEVSYFIKDLSLPNIVLCFEEKKARPAASLIKLPLLAVALKAVKEKKVSFAESIIIKRRDFIHGSGAIKRLSSPVKFSFKRLLEIMIAYSDNIAANKVIDILGFDYINNGFKELDLKGTVLRRKMMDFSRRKQGIDNYTTAYDIGSLLTKIYYKRILDKRLCGYAASLLKNQKINDRIPYFLPEEVEVAHKTGFEKGVVHDAGIIFSPQGQDYILCVLTAKGRGYNEAKKLIAQVSLLTYNLIK